jgi:hypothetical protein
MASGGLVKGNHRIQIEKPDDRLARGEIGDNIANLNGVPVTRAVTLTAAKAGAGFTGGSVSASSSKPTAGRFRKVVVPRFLVRSLVHTFPS